MRKTKSRRRIMAVAMAFLMVVALIPVNYLSGLFTVKAETGATVWFDLSQVAIPEGTTTVEYSAETVFGDIPVLATSSKKVKVMDCTADGITDENGNALKRKLALGGTGNKTYRCVKITVPFTAEITVMALSSGAEGRTLKVVDETDAQVVAFTMNALADKVVPENKVTVKAGTYYMYSAGSGIDIYDIDVQRVMTMDIASVAIPEGTTAVEYSAETVLGDVSVLATSSKKVKVMDCTADGITDENGNAFTRKLALGGTGTTAQRCVKITVPFTAEITVMALSSGAEGRTLKVVDETNTQVAAFTMNALADKVVPENKVTVKAGTYYMYSAGSGIDIYDITVNRALSFDLSGIAEDALGTDIATEFTAGDFTVIASSSGKVKVAVPDGISNDEGTAFTRKLSLGGSGNKGKRAVKFTLDFVTEIDVYALSSGDADRTLKIENEAGTVVGQLAAISKSNTVVPAQSIKLAPGTYYMYSAGSGIDVFDIRIKPDSKPLTPWEEVATPEITKVEQDATTGNFIVSFTGKVDKYAGANYIMISMQSNGNEVASAKIKDGRATSVEMVPYWNGDYKFTITAVREGEAYKVGNTVEYKDFKLKLKEPKFRMLESVGGGKVYVDWIANEYVKNYDVYYKLSTDADYTKVTTTTADEYTISGLTVGSTYSIKVVGHEDGTERTSEWVQDVVITEKAAEKNWNAALVGSGQTTTITVTDAAGNATAYSFDVSDESNDKTQVKDAVDVVNTAGKVAIANTGGGKISDSEEGFHYYYTMVNPNTENFKMSATFTIVDPKGYDGQSGFGIIATDVLGVNEFGEGTYVHKNFNSVGTYYYGVSSKAMATTSSFRYVTGHSNADTSVTDGIERVNTRKAFKAETVIEAGKSYTYTLEKTNDKFIGTFNGETIELDDTSILSVQEDGSICVGIFAVRCMGVEVSDIKFETSESTGVTNVVKDTKVTPDTRIYSTNTSGATDYEVIYASNVAGTLVVTAPDGTVCDSVAMTADSVARVSVKLTVGKNDIKTLFIPDKNADLTSYADIKKDIAVECKQIGAENGAIYVSPDGTATGAGTKTSPMDLAQAVQYARPGQVIVLMDGEYTKSISIPRSVSGTPEKNITLMAENTGKAVFTGGAGLTVVGSYWHVYGINVVGAAGVGIQVGGNYNTIEMCVIQGCANSGLQISRSQGSATNAQGIKGLLWPSYNLIKNCESFDNCDPGKNDADGFAAKLTCGEGNKFYGCSSHNNIDDGWDLFAKVISGPIGQVTIENCIAYDNGILTDGSAMTEGEGNGFKLGGGYLAGGHILKNSIAFNNLGKGITSNSCPDVKIYNCISYGNLTADRDGYNIGLNTKASLAKEWIVEGVISMNKSDNTKYSDMIPFALHNDKNYIYNGSASYNSLGEEAVDSWFVSTDVSVKPERNADGSINMHGLLQLTDEFKATHINVGAYLVTTGADAISSAPEIPGVSGNEGPATGDTTNAVPFAVMLLLSMAFVAGCFFNKKRSALAER